MMLKRLYRTFRESGLVWSWLAVLVIACDFFSKQWVMTHLTLGESIPVLPFFSLTMAHNTGAAFSFLHTASGWQNVFFGGLAAMVSFVLLIWLSQLSRKKIWMCVALTLIIGGALGNAFDRVMYGYVIDFAHFYLGDWHFAIFNIADSAICIGALMIMLNWAFVKNP